MKKDESESESKLGARQQSIFFKIEMILSQRREKVTQKVFLYESAPPIK